MIGFYFRLPAPSLISWSSIFLILSSLCVYTQYWVGTRWYSSTRKEKINIRERASDPLPPNSQPPPSEPARPRDPWLGFFIMITTNDHYLRWMAMTGDIAISMAQYRSAYCQSDLQHMINGYDAPRSSSAKKKQPSYLCIWSYTSPPPPPCK